MCGLNNMPYDLRPRMAVQKYDAGESDGESTDEDYYPDEEDSEYSCTDEENGSLDPDGDAVDVDGSPDPDGVDIDGDSDMSEPVDFASLGKSYRLQSPIRLSSSAPTRREYFSIPPKYTKEEREYLTNLTLPERKKLITLDSSVSFTKDYVPLRFRILNTQMDEHTKRIVLNKLNNFSQMVDTTTGEYFKLKNWLDHVHLLPFEKYVSLPVIHTDPLDKITLFMNSVKQTLEETVYGHTEAKMQIMRIVAQWISNPGSYGHCIGIQGSMGVGKTSLIKNGLSKALGIPFGFVALGGAADGSFLEGHLYTYEGSSYGKIAEILIKTQCSNPILFFDELDKVSSTKKGEEIIGILTHLTDPTQNEKFNDKYFGEIDINLSKALIIFSYNDESLINPILKDRLITIKVEGYKRTEKLIIAKNYLIPEIFKTYGFGPEDILLSDKILELIIDNVQEEEGVRNLKRGIECLVGWVNMYKYVPSDEFNCVIPFTITDGFVHKHLKKTTTESFNRMYT